MHHYRNTGNDDKDLYRDLINDDYKEERGSGSSYTSNYNNSRSNYHRRDDGYDNERDRDRGDRERDRDRDQRWKNYDREPRERNNDYDRERRYGKINI